MAEQLLLWDFDSIAERMKQRILEKLSSKDLLFWGTNAAVVDTIADELADACLFGDVLDREANWDTALNLTTVMNQVAFYGYKPYLKKGARGQVKVGISPGFDVRTSSIILIPKFTSFSGAGLFFASVDNVTFTEAAYALVDIIQGKVAQQTFQITQSKYPFPYDLKYLTLEVIDPDIENELFEVTVNGNEYRELDHIRLGMKDEFVYQRRIKQKFAGVDLQFGNGFFGKQLQWGDIVTVRYLQTVGAGGDILSANLVTKINDELKTYQGNKVQLYVTNVAPILGSSDHETVQDIKVSAPLFLQSNNRAVTANDYILLLRQKAGLQQVIVWGEAEENEDRGNAPGTYLEPSENVIHIAGFTLVEHASNLFSPYQGVSVSDGNEDENPNVIAIRKALNEVKGITDIIQFAPTYFVYIVFHVNAYVRPMEYSADTVRTAVIEKLIENYALKNVVYRNNIYRSNYYAMIDNLREIVYHESYMSYIQNTMFTSPWQFSFNFALRNIKSGSVRLSLHIKEDPSDLWHLFALDSIDSNGHADPNGLPNNTGQLMPYPPFLFQPIVMNLITGELGYMGIEDTSINEDMSEGILNMKDPINNWVEIKIEYQITEPDAIVPHRNTVLGFASLDLTVNASDSS
jgi:hypothetical protein